MSTTATIIKINPEYSKLVNPLSSLEYQSLKTSIEEKGMHLPIIINQDNILLDGHNRYQICQELGIEPRFETKIFGDELEEKEFVIEINLKRRQLNNFQKIELAYELEKVESKRARLRQLSTLKDVKDKLPPFTSFEGNGEKGETADIVSKKVGISRGTYERGKKIIEKGSEEVKEKLRKGQSTIYKEYNKIKKNQKREELLLQSTKNQK